MTVDPTTRPAAEHTSVTPGGVAYGDLGCGDIALVFLPGWCGPRTLFEPLATRLAESFRTLTVDWRGHGDSAPATGEFGTAELADDAIAAIEHSGAATVVPVSSAHAGWIAIELRRRLGPERVPAIVLLDWMVLGAPQPFTDALAAMADPAATRHVVDQISGMWQAGLDLPALTAYVASMTGFTDEMWARAARAITAAFEQHPTPLDALDALDRPPATLHLYAQPADPAFLEAQRGYGASRPWFTADRLDAASHFPMFEVPEQIADRIHRFLG